MNRRRLAVLAWVCLVASGAATGTERTGGAKNVVLMIADGAGFNAWKATAMYEGTRGKEFHDGAGWVRLAASTHALRRHEQPSVSAAHGLIQIPSLVYDPVRAWDTTPDPGGVGAYPYYFAGYKWLRQTAPDSAATMTSMVTGFKTYNGGINFDGSAEPVAETVAALAHASGRRVGIVTSVQFGDATPAAAAGAHHAQRKARCELAVEILTGPYPQVIAGCGHPDFDNNGEPIRDPEAKSYSFVGGQEIWNVLTGDHRLAAGDQVCAAGGGPAIELTAAQIADLESWTLRQSKAEIEKLLAGSPPERLLIVPQVGEVALQRGGIKDSKADDAAYVGGAAVADDHGAPLKPDLTWIGGTLQQQRGSRADPRYTPPGYDPPIAGVPSLETLTRVALNALDGDDDGFFLHVEGGAVDWAMHENQLGRAVEEMMDFKRSVEAVTDWVESHGGWDETLLIVTADHDHLLWGPRADSVPFDPLRDNGTGRLPFHRWLSSGHSNSLVPLYARGVEAERFASLVRSEDPFFGRYVDQTDIFLVLQAALRTSR